jgi:hypothetical protein
LAASAIPRNDVSHARAFIRDRLVTQIRWLREPVLRPR